MVCTVVNPKILDLLKIRIKGMYNEVDSMLIFNLKLNVFQSFISCFELYLYISISTTCLGENLMLLFFCLKC